MRVALLLLLLGFAQSTSIPYFNNFDSLPSDWQSSGWSFGIPDKTGATACRSGSCLGTSLTDTVPLNTLASLLSPIFDLTNVSYAQLSFYSRFSFAPSQDGVYQDGLTVAWYTATNWGDLGSRNSRGARNWFDAELIPTIGSAGFGGKSKDWNTTNAYTKSSIILPDYLYGRSDVQFEFFVFVNQTGDFGAFIDDFAITIPSRNLSLPKCPVNVQQRGFEFTWQRDPTEMEDYPVEYRLYVDGTPNFDSYYPIGPDMQSRTAVLPPNTTLYYKINAVGYYGQQVNCSLRTGVPHVHVDLPYVPDLSASPDLEMVPLRIYNNLDSWVIGDPVTKFGTPAPSGTPALLTGISGNYTNGEFSAVFTPYINIPSTGFGVVLSFDIIFDTELGYDGIQVIYTSNGGQSFDVLGAFGDYNWFNTPNIAFLGDTITSNADGWTGSSNGNWTRRLHALPSDTIGSEVMFGFVFASDYSIVSLGAGIANIRVELADSSVIPYCPVYNITMATLKFPAVFSWERGNQPRDDLPYGYKFYLSENGNFDENSGTNVPGTSYIPFLEPSTTYFWKVEALGTGQSSQNCQIFNFTTSIAELKKLPYSTDFNSQVEDWESGGKSSSWKLNNGIWKNSNSANGRYNFNEISWVLSPYFDLRNFTGIPVVSFDLGFDTEEDYDGASFQYTYDGLGKWVSVGTVGSTWYNQDSVTALFNLDPEESAGWTGVGNGRMRTTVPGIVGKIVKLRLLFASDGLYEASGVSFSNFKLEAYGVVVSTVEPPKTRPTLKPLNTNIPTQDPVINNGTKMIIGFLFVFVMLFM